jgi:hypothetical protein
MYYNWCHVLVVNVIYFHWNYYWHDYNQMSMSNSIELRVWNLFRNDYFIYSLLTQIYDKDILHRQQMNKKNMILYLIQNFLLHNFYKELRTKTTIICRCPYIHIFVQCTQKNCFYVVLMKHFYIINISDFQLSHKVHNLWINNEYLTSMQLLETHISRISIALRGIYLHAMKNVQLII